MTLSEYQIFITIAQTKSLTTTSKVMHLSKSAISHALTRMEDELEMPLFERSKRGLILTPYGSELLQYANSVLRANEQFIFHVKNLQGLESGIVRIGTCSSVCSNWIPDIISKFKKKHPNIEIQVRGGACNKYIIDWILENEIDIGIGSSPPNSLLNIEEIYTDEMICIAPKDIDISNKEYITSDELSKQSLLMQEYPFNEESQFTLDAVNAQPTCYITGYDDATLIAMAEGSLGCCVMGKLCIKRMPAAVKVFSFEEKQYRKFAILTRRGLQQSPATKSMCNIIREYSKIFPDNYDLHLL
ncbi:MAG: LysR family transcriptional regulator [Prevotellaceae bacterium]|nr:LysR family transcriptional regulator [Prevotellaceae bacterium]